MPISPREVLRKHSFATKHSLGQHFLFDEDLLAHLVELAGITAEDDVLEIGPGSGTLTRQLAAHARRVLAVEIDRDLLSILAETLADCPNVTVIHSDILHTDVAPLFAGRFKALANLPYYLTTELLTRLLTAKLPMDTLAVMVQAEVGDKMIAEPGAPEYGPLAVLCRYFADTRKALRVPAGRFSPPPKVDSVFMRLDIRAQPPVVCEDEALLLRVIRCAFAMRRKTLLNNLRAGFGLDKAGALDCVGAAGLSTDIRGERMCLADFAAIATALIKMQVSKSIPSKT
ncbi:MAG: 16S rRNA (adenine(1518)-N(6)/adenine(1519)-N(6))-dimethyltransferase RsmA [Clostridia bacterium]|nr:16S rRNA (adenine(1518)-N(6)/adenine(1519)-N(6))-dimethyltransferase RsmA [Clostridia bacterium]